MTELFLPGETPSLSPFKLPNFAPNHGEGEEPLAVALLTPVPPLDPNRDIGTDLGRGSIATGDPVVGERDQLESSHKEFHCAVLRALGTSLELRLEAPDQSQETEEEVKGQSPTRTPPSTPVRREEEPQQEKASKDGSDAAILQQTLPDPTPDEASQSPSPLPSEAPAPSQTAQPSPSENQELPAASETAEDAAAATAGDQGSDESPSKSPSKKKKKFRTPSFLKKSKKKES